MNRLAGPTVAAVCFALLGTAQSVAAQDKPNVEISGGYQLLHLWVADTGESQTLGKGWYADVAGNLTPSLGVVFQASGNYRTETSTFSFEEVVVSGTAHLKVHQFFGGIRASARENKRAVPFGQVLVGAVHVTVSAEATATSGGQSVSSSGSGEPTTDFGMQFGGGVNIMLTKKIGVRAGIDYIRVFDEDADVNGIRFAIGAVFAF